MPPTRRSRLLFLALLATALALPGCAASLRGLVKVGVEPGVGPPDVRLQTLEGRWWRLRLVEDGLALRALDGCTVQVEGRGIARSFLVSAWQVLDAGDGSAPFVGEVHRLGVNLLIDDKNSGMEIILDEAGFRDLALLEGRLVMLRGYIIGPQTLRVVSYRVLIE